MIKLSILVLLSQIVNIQLVLADAPIGFDLTIIQPDLTKLDKIMADNFDGFDVADLTKRFYERMKLRNMMARDTKISRWQNPIKVRGCDKSPKKAR